MKIALIRHGETRANHEGRYIGTTDEPLVSTGALRYSYPDCERIVVSPLRRCVETAEFIYPDRKLTICPDLRECDFGDFENKSYEELKDNEYYKRWLESNGTLPFPNGESREEFEARCVRGFYDSLDGAESIAFVVHGGTIMAVMHALYGGFYEYRLRCGGMICFEYDAAQRIAGEYIMEGNA